MKAMFWDFEGLPLYEILPQKQQSTVTNNVDLSKNCTKPLNERQLTAGVRLLHDEA
jgi:hypothetical protein